MGSSKTVSFRISYENYEKILLECDAKNITVSEFIERKIAIAGAVNEFKNKVIKKLEDAFVMIDNQPSLAKNKLKRILNFIALY